MTLGGYYAVISSIDPNSEDCLEGYLLVPGEEPRVFQASWNASGLCRNHRESANIVISRSNALGSLIDMIRHSDH